MNFNGSERRRIVCGDSSGRAGSRLLSVIRSADLQFSWTVAKNLFSFTTPQKRRLLPRLAQDEEPGGAGGEARGGGGLGQGALAMKQTEKTQTYFAFRIAAWTASSSTWPASRTTPWRWRPTERRS